MSSINRHQRVARCLQIARDALIDERNASGHWIGELSASALSTATAVMALEMVRRDGVRLESGCDDHSTLIQNGLTWLAGHQNDDGGWGDTTKSFSNISTTMLAHAVFIATGTDDTYRTTVEAAKGYIDRTGGVAAVLKRYGRDKTFSIPILTHCALAGMVDWKDVAALPFELACLPPGFYKTVRLPVVSYALPALIAIGQVRHHHRKPFNPLTRLLRRLSIRPSLKVLQRIQPSNGGFLEAAPLTSFVTMSLAGKGLSEHPVAKKGVEFLVGTVSDDGSWPIDTNLATWVTTLSVNALGGDLPADEGRVVSDWLLAQQYKSVHPYTSADPGGWAWTDLPGGVPDADDTAGAILALLSLHSSVSSDNVSQTTHDALANAVQWLLNLQNRNGGWPTFCRGWGALPFDRSAADISAHALRALGGWLKHLASGDAERSQRNRAERAVHTGFKYLAQTQRPDGSWLPLWFGNQHAHDDENSTYGTARVLAAYRDHSQFDCQQSRRGIKWLLDAQNIDGGWGGAAGTPSSVEETALAVELLLSAANASEQANQGLSWLMDRVEDGTYVDASPIGFYFAKLWYFERLYPRTFMVAALRRADAQLEQTDSRPGAEKSFQEVQGQPILDRPTAVGNG